MHVFSYTTVENLFFLRRITFVHAGDFLFIIDGALGFCRNFDGLHTIKVGNIHSHTVFLHGDACAVCLQFFQYIVCHCLLNIR